ncbi:MAG: DSD1 family PLP-dependent enzyme [Betaproteobacteria bacterium]|nr:DSD1 family PLP-dependent enzyme [Betaproteobacteria bacterium]
MAAYLPARIGQPVAEIDTPSLVIDLDAFERNLEALPRSIAGRDLRVRAHAKTHKCPEIAQRQIRAGAIGVCCQKVAEAEAMVEGGVGDVLVANQVVGASKLERLARLARRAKIGVCVDDAGNIEAIAAAAHAAGVTLDVYVEVDVGARRCGVAPGEPVAELARKLKASSSLRFAGLQAYQGAAQHIRSVEQRRAAIGKAAEAVRASRAALAASGIDCPIVTGAGSGSYLYELETGAWNEIQPGSYIFMDADYAKNEWAAPQHRFEHALFVLATVMSRAIPGHAVLDAGLKASSVDSGPPAVWRMPGVHCTRVSDEHAVLASDAGAAEPRLGQKLLLVPGHCDPTVNLHDWYVCVRGGMDQGAVEVLWPITARGAVY